MLVKVGINMDEELDAGLDMSSNMDTDSEISFDADSFTGGDVVDIPDDIGEDLSEDLDFSTVSDLDTVSEEFIDSIDEDVNGTAEGDLSGDMGNGFADDSVADLAGIGETDISDIPEDIEDDTQMDGMEAADYSGDDPDDISEDTLFLDDEVPYEIPDMADIPEDIAEFEDSVSDYGTNGLDIPEDVTGKELSDSTIVDEIDVDDIDSHLVVEGASGELSDDGPGMEDKVAADIFDGDGLDKEAEAAIKDPLFEANNSASDMDADDIHGSVDMICEDNNEGIAEHMDTDTEKGLDTSADISAYDTDLAEYNGYEDSLTDQTGFTDEVSSVGDDIEVKADTDTERTPMQELSSYMNDHNYGPNDFDEYSKDPEWQRLHEAVFPDWEGRPELEKQSVSEMEEAPYEYHFSGYETHEFPETESSSASHLDHGSSSIEERGELEEIVSDISRDIEERPSMDTAPVSGDENINAEQFDTSRDVGNDMISGQEMLDRYGVSQLRNGADYFVKGDNYDQFEREYYAPEDLTYTKYETPEELDISPSLIEGIHLGKSEVEDPAVFWSQHDKSGTAESFQEIASHIPEVRERMAAGDTLDNLMDDEKLSDCANIYFRNMPEVIERNGYYEFGSNGRHRILAARALGYDIPVRVIGKRS